LEKDRELTENEILDRAYSKKNKKYGISKLVDNSTHSNIIKKVSYSPYSDSLTILENNSGKLKFYTNQC